MLGDSVEVNEILVEYTEPVSGSQEPKEVFSDFKQSYVTVTSTKWSTVTKVFDLKKHTEVENEKLKSEK